MKTQTTKTTKQPEKKHSLKISKACAVKFTAFCKARGLRIDFATEQALSLWMKETERAK